METNEQNLVSTVEENFQEENIEPTKETRVAKGLKSMGKLLIVVAVFIALFALVCASHTYSYHL